MLTLPRRGSRFVVIDLSNEQFSAVMITLAGQSVRVGARVCVDLPSDIESGDDEWLGKWMGRTLEEHGIGRWPVVFLVPRQSVGLKHLELPSTRTDELPGMVALTMAGQLPFPADGSIIDYAVVSQQQGRSHVVAAAVRHELIDRYKALARFGHLKMIRIALRPLATAALAAEFSRGCAGSLLAVDLRRFGEVEIVVVSEGVVRYARAAEVVSASEEVDRHEEARRLATEAKRSWMSFRATEESPDLQHVIVMGPDGLAGAVAEEVRASLGRTTEVFFSHPKVTGKAATLDCLWPLVGVGLEQVEALDGVNFLRPKKAPDVAARTRQRALGGVAAGIVVFGAVWTIGNQHLRRLEARLASLQEQSRSLLPAYLEHERNRLRLEHLERWEKVQFNWLEHLAYVSDHLPPTDQAILGSFSASMTEGARRWREGQWTAAPSFASLQFNGAAISRPIADAIRSAFVNDETYETTPIGTDTSSNDKTYTEAFNLRLRTTRGTPYEGGADRPHASEIDVVAPAGAEGAIDSTSGPFEFGGREESAPQSGSPAEPATEAAPAGGEQPANTAPGGGRRRRSRDPATPGGGGGG